MFEDDVYKLDVLIALEQSSMSTVQLQSGGEGFRAHIKDLCEAKNLHQEADELGDDADFYDDLATWQALGQDEEGVSSQLHGVSEGASNTTEEKS